MERIIDGRGITFELIKLALMKTKQNKLLSIDQALRADTLLSAQVITKVNTEVITSSVQRKRLVARGKLYPFTELVSHSIILANDRSGVAIMLVHNEKRGWEVPGGHLERQESIAQSLTREFNEEAKSAENSHFFSVPRVHAHSIADFVVMYTACDRAFVDYARCIPLITKPHLPKGATRESKQPAKWFSLFTLKRVIQSDSSATGFNKENLTPMIDVVEHYIQVNQALKVMMAKV